MNEEQKVELKLIHMEEVVSKEVSWLWYPYIPYGKITVIEGDPGEGKTTLVLKLAAMLSKGLPLPCDDDRPYEPIHIIYQTAEDGIDDTIKPRLEQNGADCSMIRVIDETEKELSMTDERLEQAIVETNAKLIILDPIQAYIGATVDMHRANEIRPVLKKLGMIAEKYQCAVILIGHMNKASGSKSTYRGLGSIDIQATARSVLLVARLRDKPNIRIMAQDKSSLAPAGDAIGFEMTEDRGMTCIGPYDITIDELLMAELFGVGVPAISKHLANIYAEGELNEISTVSKMEIVQQEGSRDIKRNMEFYNLDAIISVGYRVNSRKATNFRIWATGILKEYMIKGFAMDDERLKQGKTAFGKDYFKELLERVRSIRASERRIWQQITDIFAECSIDYDKDSQTTHDFYAMVQNKFHYAITGQTAAEIIDTKADHTKEHMGLTTWKNSPDGRILKSDVTIATTSFVLLKKKYKLFDVNDGHAVYPLQIPILIHSIRPSL